MVRWIKVAVLLSVVEVLSGCSSGVKELGPADPSQVPTPNQEDVKKQMEESAKHMPPGAKMPPGMMPGRAGNAEAPPDTK